MLPEGRDDGVGQVVPRAQHEYARPDARQGAARIVGPHAGRLVQERAPVEGQHEAGEVGQGGRAGEMALVAAVLRVYE